MSQQVSDPSQLDSGDMQSRNQLNQTGIYDRSVTTIETVTLIPIIPIIPTFPKVPFVAGPISTADWKVVSRIQVDPEDD